MVTMFVNELAYSENTTIHNRGVSLCYPGQYSPGAGLYVATILKFVDGQLDEPQGERLLYLPSSFFETAIPGYIETYHTALNPSMGKTVNGILYPLNAPPTLHPLFQDAWNGKGDFEDPEVEKDENGLFRLYLHPALRERKVAPWIMTESPPPVSPKSAAPMNWPVGYCSYVGIGTDTYGYTCKVDFYYKNSFHYRFQLHEQNIQLRNEVKAQLEKLFQKWEKNCGTASE